MSNAESTMVPLTITYAYVDSVASQSPCEQADELMLCSFGNGKLINFHLAANASTADFDIRSGYIGCLTVDAKWSGTAMISTSCASIELRARGTKRDDLASFRQTVISSEMLHGSFRDLLHIQHAHCLGMSPHGVCWDQEVRNSHHA